MEASLFNKNEPEKPKEFEYIGSRTGEVFIINARKDSDGYELPEDYFPESIYTESDTSTSSTEADEDSVSLFNKNEPVKGEEFEYIGSRTGEVFKINARKDSDGYELPEDYFPESIYAESDTSTSSTEDSDNDSIENKENKLQPLEPGEKSYVSSLLKENKENVTPQVKEFEFSENLTGTAIKCSATSTEPSPQFFGSKKRLFTEMTNITREKISKTEEDIDVVGLMENGEAMNSQSQEVTYQKTKVVDDTLIVDVEGNTTLEEEKKLEVVADNFNLTTADQTNEDGTTRVKKAARKSKKVVSNKSIKEKEENQEETSAENKASHAAEDEKAVKKISKTEEDIDVVGLMENGEAMNNQSQEVTYQKNKDDTLIVDVEGNTTLEEEKKVEVVADSLNTADQTNEDGTTRVKKATKKSKKVSNKSFKGKEENQEETSAEKKASHEAEDEKAVKKRATRKSTRTPQGNTSNAIQVMTRKAVTRAKSKQASLRRTTCSIGKRTPAHEGHFTRSKSNKSMTSDKGNLSGESKSGKSESKSKSAEYQTIEDGSTHVSPVKKAAKKSKKVVTNKSFKEKEENQEETSAETKASHEAEDEKAVKKRPTRKSTRTPQGNTSKQASLRRTSIGKRTPARERHFTRSKINKIMTSDKGSKSKGAVEDEEEPVVQGEDGRNRSLSLEIEDDMPRDAEYEANDTVAQDTEGGERCADTLKDRESKRRSQRNKKRMSDEADSLEVEEEGDSGSCDADGDDEQDRKPTQSRKKTKKMKVANKEGFCPATLSNSSSSSHDDDNKDQDGNENNSNIVLIVTKKTSKEKSGKESSSSSIASDSDKNGVDKKTQPKKRKRSKVTMTRRSRRKPRRIDSEPTEIDVTGKGGTTFEGVDGTKDDGINETHDKTIDKSSRKRTNQTRIESVHIAHSSTPVLLNKSSNYTEPTGNDVTDKGGTIFEGLDGTKDDGINETHDKTIDKSSRKRTNQTRIESVHIAHSSTPVLLNKSSNYTEPTGNDVTDKGGTIFEGLDGTKDDGIKETDDKTIEKSSRKRTNRTRIESMRVTHSSTPVLLNESSNVMLPCSIKSILKSSVPGTSADAKKRRVSIALNETGSTSGEDDNDDDHDGGKSNSPCRRRKSSVSFAPTPSFQCPPDDFSTLEESPGKLAKLSFVTNYSGFTSGDNTFTPGVPSSASLSSSDSSFEPVSDTSSVNESQEITVNLSKRKQTAQEEEQDDSAVRRSKRTKVPPLKYWKNERIKYERRQSGWFVSGIDRVTTPAVPKRKTRKPKEAKKRAIRKDLLQEEALVVDNEADDMQEVTYTTIPAIDPDTGIQVEMDLIRVPEMLHFINTSGKPAKPEDPMIMDKCMSNDLFGVGQVILRPGAEKGNQHVRNDTMIFLVMEGKVNVTIYETEFAVPVGSSFCVPKGNWYNLENVSDSDTRLYFVQIKGEQPNQDPRTKRTPPP